MAVHRDRAPTRTDVARRAGVSPPVVSYVLNQSNYVSADTRKRVEEAIRELGYRPNRIARGLKTMATQHILFVANDIRNSFFANLAFEMETYARTSGYSLALAHAHTEGNDIMAAVSGFYDGLVVFSDRIPIEQLNAAAASGLATVFSGNRRYAGLDERITTVDIGVVEGMQLLVSHLAAAGHRRIAFFPGTTVKSLEGDNFRMIGYREGLAAAGLGYDESLVRVIGGDGEQLVRERCQAILALAAPPTALICGNDAMAVRAVRAFHDLGVRVPADIAVTGFGNFPDSESTIPSITTVGIRVDDLARQVVDAIVTRIGGGDPTPISLARELYRRESA